MNERTVHHAGPSCLEKALLNLKNTSHRDFPPLFLVYLGQPLQWKKRERTTNNRSEHRVVPDSRPTTTQPGGLDLWGKGRLKATTEGR